MEIWKYVKKYPYYQISNMGNVRSKDKYCKTGIKNNSLVLRKGKILNPVKYNNGYLYVTLYNHKKTKRYAVHKLVAENFINNINNYKEINHKDANKVNNCAKNLEWITHGENIKHAWRMCFSEQSKQNSKRNLMLKIEKSKKSVNQYDLQGNFIKTWNNITEASRSVCIDWHSIDKCCQGQVKNPRRYWWTYV